jgi:hypothetical protein
MNEPAFVNRAQPFGQRRAEFTYRFRLERASGGNDRGQGGASYISGNHPWRISVRVSVYDRRRVEASHEARRGNFPRKPVPELSVRYVIAKHDLNCDFPATRRYAKENPPHAACTEPAKQAVYTHVSGIVRLEGFHPPILLKR